MPGTFNRLLAAWFASVTGDGMRFAALPLLALSLSPSPAAVSAVAAATTLPWLLVALPAGALVDRLDPAAVISWANAGRALATALLVLAVLTDRAGIPLLCLVGFVLTAGETFADSAGQSLLVRLVPQDRLETANARFVSSENVGLDLIGPLAAGALFVIAHWLPFAIAAVIFLGTAYALLSLRGTRVSATDVGSAADPARLRGLSSEGSAGGDPAPGATSSLQPDRRSAGVPSQGTGAGPSGGGSDAGPEGTGTGRRVGSSAGRDDASRAGRDNGGIAGDPAGAKAAQHLSVRAGFQVIFADAELRVLVITVAIMSAAIAAAEGVLVVYSDSSLHLPEAFYPTLLACYSVGLVLAAAAMSRWGARLRAGAMMVAAVVLIGVTLLVMGVFPHAVVAWWSFLAMGAAGGVWNVLSASRRQRRTPRSMVARVSSTFRAISWGALPLGTALGGLIGQTRSVPTVFVVSGVVVLVLAAGAGRFLVAGDGGDRNPVRVDEPSVIDRSGAAEAV